MLATFTLILLKCVDLNYHLQLSIRTTAIRYLQLVIYIFLSYLPMIVFVCSDTCSNIYQRFTIDISLILDAFTLILLECVDLNYHLQLSIRTTAIRYLQLVIYIFLSYLPMIVFVCSDTCSNIYQRFTIDISLILDAFTLILLECVDLNYHLQLSIRTTAIRYLQLVTLIMFLIFLFVVQEFCLL